MFNRNTSLFLLLLSIFWIGCESTPTDPGNGDDPVSPPTVDLKVDFKVDYTEPSDSIAIANGESVVLSWDTENSPETCRVSGGGWSGIVNCSAGVDTLKSIEGPDSFTLVMRVSNSAGSDSDSVTVDVAAPGERHAISDREDDLEGRQVHIIYATSKDGRDRELDLNGKLQDMMNEAQSWFKSQTGGREIRFDTYNGRLDITFIRLPLTNNEIISMGREFREEDDDLVREAGLKDFNKNYIVYYDGKARTEACGWASMGGSYGFAYFQACTGVGWEVGIHELFHTFGVVDEDAPNNCEGAHVCDEPGENRAEGAGDIMGVGSASGPRILDINNDDYYAQSLPDSITNIYYKEHFTPPQN